MNHITTSLPKLVSIKVILYIAHLIACFLSNSDHQPKVVQRSFLSEKAHADPEISSTVIKRLEIIENFYQVVLSVILSHLVVNIVNCYERHAKIRYEVEALLSELVNCELLTPYLILEVGENIFQQIWRCFPEPQGHYLKSTFEDLCPTQIDRKVIYYTSYLKLIAAGFAQTVPEFQQDSLLSESEAHDRQIKYVELIRTLSAFLTDDPEVADWIDTLPAGIVVSSANFTLDVFILVKDYQINSLSIILNYLIGTLLVRFNWEQEFKRNTENEVEDEVYINIINRAWEFILDDEEQRNQLKLQLRIIMGSLEDSHLFNYISKQDSVLTHVKSLID